MAIFDVSADGSSLKLKGHQLTKGKWPRNFNILDDLLLVANQESNNVVSFKILNDGSLTEINEGFSCPQPVCLKFLKL